MRFFKVKTFLMHIGSVASSTMLHMRTTIVAATYMVVAASVANVTPYGQQTQHAVAARLPMVAPVDAAMPAATTVEATEEPEATKSTIGAADPLSSIRITSRFGGRVHPVTGKYRAHQGVDYDAELEDPVYSVLPGKISFAGKKGGYGNAVEVFYPQHGTTTLYAHLNSIQVEKGQTVGKGETLGGAGTTGVSTGVHLHLAVKRDGTYIEPLRYLAGAGDESNLVVATAQPGAKRKRATHFNARVITAKSKSKSRSRTSIAKSTKRGAAKIIVAKAGKSKKSNAVQIAKASKSLTKFAKATKSTKIAKSTKKKLNATEIANLENRFTRASREARTFAKLYEDGIISRRERDTKMQAANNARSKFEAAKKD